MLLTTCAPLALIGIISLKGNKHLALALAAVGYGTAAGDAAHGGATLDDETTDTALTARGLTGSGLAGSGPTASDLTARGLGRWSAGAYRAFGGSGIRGGNELIALACAALGRIAAAANAGHRAAALHEESTDSAGRLRRCRTLVDRSRRGQGEGAEEASDDEEGLRQLHLG